MPANEQTWRSPTLLHIIFGVTSLSMLLATIWMFAKDHTREWKDYQKATNAVNQFYIQGRAEEEQTLKFAQDLQQAKLALAEARKLPVRSEDVAEFKQLVEADAERRGAKPFDLAKAEANLSATDGDGDAISAQKRREAILSILQAALGEAKYREDTLLQERKFAAANLTATLSLRDLAVTEGRPKAIVEQRQKVVDLAKEKVDELSTKYEAAGMHRRELESVLKRVTAPVDDAEANLVKVQADVKRFQDSIEGFSQKVGRTILGMPILDAFDNSDLTIEQIWLPTLTINYNFSNVPRYDRCITCHRSTDATQPGAPTEPAYEREQAPFTVKLETPPEQPTRPEATSSEATTEAPEVGRPLSHDEWMLREAYGLLLAKEGVLNPSDVTVQVVWPKVDEAPARAAEAGLRMGDVIVAINGTPVVDRKSTLARLVGEVTWGKPIQLTIRRGLPHPFASHPRLDLFCGSTSPHPQGAMGCTICHDGQGSATQFKWASHTPNTPGQGDRWRQEHGWFNNHHWIFPMYPQRFLESGCLKCHHEVVELEPSRRFPEPPAPKLMAGYQLVRQYGCFGCHEINGFDGPSKRIGPDMRAEPNFFAVAQALLMEPNLTPEERGWAEQIVYHPERDQPRHRLMQSIQLDKQLRAKDPESAVVEAAAEADDTEGEKLAARFSLSTYRLGEQLKDVESPGSFRKPGPSLRYLSSKVNFDFLYDWVRNPVDFRPTTKMPRFFGLWSHLSEAEQQQTAPLEEIEIRAISKFLLDSSQPFQYLPPLEDAAPASVARGAQLFQTRGCLACHTHADFPGIDNTQGPDLSLLAAKFNDERGRQWLYTWLRDPSKYHVRTKMPNMLLEPVPAADGAPTDPIADMTAFLTTTGVGLDLSVSEDEVEIARVVAGGSAAAHGQLKSGDLLEAIGQGADGEMVSVADKTAEELIALLRGAAGSTVRLLVKPPDADEASPIALERLGYQPQNPPSAELSAEQQDSLYALALENLKKTYPLPTAKRYLQEGILDLDPASMKGDDVVLVGEINDANRSDKLLLYVGRRAVSKYGCAGCHDIPGYEDAKPIGTGLADWGRKDPSRLAFEQISQFLPMHGGDHAASHAAHHGDLPPYHLTPEEVASPDTQFFFDAIANHDRQGFIWQKLRQPRSFDYEKVSNKEFNDRLRMPQFPFDAKEREAVMTFILGLVAEPPATKYIYTPDPRQDAIVKGRQVLEKFNCAGCHTLDMEQWNFAFAPDDENYGGPPPAGGFPFLQAHATSEHLAASLKTDRRGMRHATAHGRPAVSEETGAPLLFNEDLDPVEPGEEGQAKELYYSLELWENAVINGHMYQVGSPNLLVRKSNATRFPMLGGDLANYLYPVVIADEKRRNPQVKGSEAWGWLPPPLVGQGQKTQTAWLHNFLLDPTPIRPAVVLRMPKFNMAPDDASRLANYFAAIDNAEYPYEFDARTASTTIEAMEATTPGRLNDALGIVVNNTYCVKCHKVGDFSPAGSEKAMGPNLANIYNRLRPDYTRRWIADPRRILPYTGMPINIPYLPEPPHYGGISQEIFPGTSFEQIDGLVDLLLNYDVFARRMVSIKPMVKAPPEEAPADGAEPPAEKEAAQADTPAAEGSPEESSAAGSTDDTETN